MIQMSITVNKNLLPAAASRVRSELPAVVGRAATDIETRAKGYAPVDTGALQADISSVHSGLSATATSGIEYGVFQEYGTRNQAGTPYMRPAAEAGGPAFQAAVAELLGRLA